MVVLSLPLIFFLSPAALSMILWSNAIHHHKSGEKSKDLFNTVIATPFPRVHDFTIEQLRVVAWSMIHADKSAPRLIKSIADELSRRELCDVPLETMRDIFVAVVKTPDVSVPVAVAKVREKGPFFRTT